MARPKSFTEQDIIAAAKNILSSGKEVTAWRVKELIVKGKLSTIQAEIDRLASEGKIKTAPLVKAIEVIEDSQDSNLVEDDIELPLEIQDQWKVAEAEIVNGLEAIVKRCNAIAAAHHESLTRARVKDAVDAKANAEKSALEAKEEVRKIEDESEDRILAQIKIVESLESELEVMFEESESFKSKISEQSHQISQLTDALEQLTGKYSSTSKELDETQQKLKSVESSNVTLMNDIGKVSTERDTVASERDRLANNLELKSDELTNIKIDLATKTQAFELSEKAFLEKESAFSALKSELQNENSSLAEKLKDAEASLSSSATELKELNTKCETLSSVNKDLELKLATSKEGGDDE